MLPIELGRAAYLSSLLLASAPLCQAQDAFRVHAPVVAVQAQLESEETPFTQQDREPKSTANNPSSIESDEALVMRLETIQFLKGIMTYTIAISISLFVLYILFKIWITYQQKKILADLPDPAPDGSWLVVAYEWDKGKMQSGRMPLEGITTIAELTHTAIEYGAEAVDGLMTEESVDIKYLDLQGIERRVVASTRFADLRRARLLRIVRRELNSEQATLMSLNKKRKVAAKDRDELDNDEMTIIEMGGPNTSNAQLMQSI